MKNIQLNYYNKFYKNKKIIDRNTKSEDADYFIKSLLATLDFNKKKILEVGCGDGYLTKFLLQKPFLKLDAIDISNIAIDKMNINFKKYVKRGELRLICDDLINYLDRNNCDYDLIIGSGVLHHIAKENWFKLFSAIQKRLNNNGILVFSPEPNASGFLFLFWKLASFFYNRVYKIDYSKDAEIGTFDMKTNSIIDSIKKADFYAIEIIPFKVIPQFNSKILFRINKYFNKKLSGKISTYITIKARK